MMFKLVLLNQLQSLIKKKKAISPNWSSVRPAPNPGCAGQFKCIDTFDLCHCLALRGYKRGRVSYYICQDLCDMALTRR